MKGELKADDKTMRYCALQLWRGENIPTTKGKKCMVWGKVIKYLSDQMKQIREYPCVLFTYNVIFQLMLRFESFLPGIPQDGKAEKRGVCCSLWGAHVLCHLLI